MFFVAIRLTRDAFDLAMNLPKIAVCDSVADGAFATAPRAALMGMIIPPGVMPIIHAFVADQSVGAKFPAGIISGLFPAHGPRRPRFCRPMHPSACTGPNSRARPCRPWG